MVLLAWVPLLLLSIAEGHAWGDRVRLPFLHDVELHVRLLIALPLLILAELVVHQRMRPVVGQFLDRGLIPDAARPQFDAAIASAMRLRNSVAAEVLLIALVYIVGVGFVWRTQVALDVPSWYGVPADGTIAAVGRRLVAGRRQPAAVPVPAPALVFPAVHLGALPVAGVAHRFAVRADASGSRGGLGFLGAVAYAFSPVLLAQGAMLAGMMANKIFYAGATLPAVQGGAHRTGGADGVRHPRTAAGVRSEAGGGQARGLREYGTLAQRYVREFDDKWLRGGAPADEPLVGTADIQSLADLGNSFEVVQWHAMGAVHRADGPATGHRHAAARGAADADDVFAAGIARAVAQGCLLTIRPSPKGSSRRGPRLI